MAGKNQEYTLGLMHLSEHGKTSLGASDGELVKVRNFPIRRITSRHLGGWLVFSKKTDFSLEVSEDFRLIGRKTKVVNAGSGSVPENYSREEFDRVQRRMVRVGMPDNTSVSYHGFTLLGLPMLAFAFTRRASARAAVRDLVTVTETTKTGGTRKRPGFRRG